MNRQPQQSQKSNPYAGIMSGGKIPRHDKYIDPKELMIEEIRFEKRMPHKDLNLPNPDLPFGVSDEYLILDTFRKSPDSDINRGEYIFHLMVQGSTGPDVTGVRERLNNIIEIQIGAFYIQPIEDLTITVPTGPYTLAAPTTVVPQYYPGQEITVYLRGAGMQAISDLGGHRHHFDLTINYNTITTSSGTSYAPIASPDMNYWDTYKFTDPIQSFNDIILNFRSPDNVLKFQPDVYYAVKSEFSAGILYFTVKNHGLQTGDVVIFTGFVSGTPIDSYINQPGGILITNRTIDELEPQPQITFSPLPTPCYVNIYVIKRRMRIPLRLRRIIDRTTNYKVPI